MDPATPTAITSDIQLEGERRIIMIVKAGAGPERCRPPSSPGTSG
jgi:hypothetical protein